MGLLRAIAFRLYGNIQKNLFFSAIKDEARKENILPINLGFLTLLGKDYLRGYPASFYLFFDKMPEINIDDPELSKMDKDISGPIYFIRSLTGGQNIKCDAKLAGAFALYSRIKHYSSSARLMRADIRLWGTSFYIEDEEYIYDPILLKKYPIDSFYHIYNPKQIMDVTDSILIKALSTFLTTDIEKEKDDFTSYADPDVLEDLYTQANSISNVNIDDDLRRYPDIKELRKYQLEQFFKDMDYNHEEGFIRLSI